MVRFNKTFTFDISAVHAYIRNGRGVTKKVKTSRRVIRTLHIIPNIQTDEEQVVLNIESSCGPP